MEFISTIPINIDGNYTQKILVTDAFLYSLGNFQHFILWFYVLCPVISNVVLRFCQKASLCASHLLQVNSTMMNLGISISPVIGWYESMQSCNTKKKTEKKREICCKKLADSNIF